MRTPICAGTALIALAFAAPAVAVPFETTLLLSEPTGLGTLAAPLVNDSRTTGGRTVTADGRFVAFVSEADGLSDADENRFENVFVRDRTTQTTILISRATGSGGAGANAESEEVSISPDGRFVAFSSHATNLGEAGTAGTSQVYVRDLLTNTTTLASRETGQSGAIGNDDSFAPDVTTVGNTPVIAFATSATNLFPGDTQDHTDIVARDGTTTSLVSARDGSTTIEGNNFSYEPSISDNGDRIAFTTSATDFIGAADDNSRRDVYVRDRSSSETILASQGGAGIGDDDSEAPSIDDAGDAVAFASSATNLTADDNSSQQDVFLRNVTGGATTRLSRKQAGQGANGHSAEPAISPDAAWVAFESNATNLDPADADAKLDVYVTNAAGNAPTLVSRTNAAVGDDESSSPAVVNPAAGLRVMFTTLANNLSPDDEDDFTQVHSRLIGGAVLAGVERTSYVSRPSGTDPFRSGVNASYITFGREGGQLESLSGDGRFAVFTSDQDNLSSEDDNRFSSVFVRDNATNTVTLVSRATGVGGAAANHASLQATISADGRRVAFVSAASNLTPADQDNFGDVFVRDLVTGETIAVSLKDDESPSPGFTTDPAIDADGDRVAFAATNSLDAADTNADTDVYLRDLTAGTTVLVSRKDGGGTSGDDSSSDPAVNAAGSRVAFTSQADDLAAGSIDPDNLADVFLRDLATADTILVSGTEGAVGANDASRSPAIDAAGNRVAFASVATNLAPATVNGGAADVIVRDLTSGKYLLASRRNGSQFGGNSTSDEPAIDAAGRLVAFASASTDLVGGDVNDYADAFVHDLEAGTTTLVSRASGAAGAQAQGSGVEDPALSADGRCVMFASNHDGLAPQPAGTDFQNVYVRAIAEGCAPAPPAAGEPDPPATTPPARDLLAPLVSRLRADPSRFAPVALHKARSTAKRKVKRGTTFRFSSSEAGKVAITVERELKGHRVGKSCRKPTAKLRKRRACKRYRRVGVVRENAKLGVNAVKFGGRFSRKALPRARYRASVVVTDAAGNRSKVKRVTFTIVRP